MSGAFSKLSGDALLLSGVKKATGKMGGRTRASVQHLKETSSKVHLMLCPLIHSLLTGK